MITPGFSSSPADWCIPAVRTLVKALAAAGHDVEVFALRYPEPARRYELEGVTVTAIGGGAARGRRRLALLGRGVRDVVASDRARRFDVLHALWAHEPAMVALAAGKVRRLPVAVSLLGGELVGLREIGYGDQLGAAGRWMVAAAMRSAPLVTCPSRYMEDLARPFRAPSRPLARIPLPVDTSLFSAVNRGAGARLAGHPALLHVASLVPVKDQALLFAAFRRILDELGEARLHVVGDGPLRGELEVLAGRLGLLPAVVFHGAKAHDALPAYYRGADLLLMSSRHESLGMVVLEAAACGCPAVGTAVGVIPDVPKSAVGVPVGDAHLLASAALAVLGNRQQREAMSGEGVAVAGELFSPPCVAAAVARLYVALRNGAWAAAGGS